MQENGLIDRILFTYPEPAPIIHTDSELEEEIKLKYEKIVHFIYNAQVKAQPSVLKFSKSAKDIWQDWHIAYCEIMNNPSTPYYEVNCMAKLESYTLRFALILEFLNCAEESLSPTEISSESLSYAFDLNEYFLLNAIKVHGSFGITTLDKKVDAVFAWIKKQENYTGNSRKIYTNRVAGLKNANEVFDVLMEMRNRRLGSFRHKNDGGMESKKTSLDFVLAEKFWNGKDNTHV
jgi:hypothetical protein